MPSKFAELRRSVEAMNAVLTADDDASYAQAERDWNAGIVALRNRALEMLDVCEAAEMMAGSDISHGDTCWPEHGCTCGLSALLTALEKFGRQG